MKVSQNWLKNLVEITSTPEDLSEKLSIGGFEVESLEDCSENVNGVVLGKVLSVLKHQGSDKLSICQVDIGTSKNLQIICGARNIKPNIYVYIATVGAKLNAVDLTSNPLIAMQSALCFFCASMIAETSCFIPRFITS